MGRVRRFNAVCRDSPVKLGVLPTFLDFQSLYFGQSTYIIPKLINDRASEMSLFQYKMSLEQMAC
jgi:hypothetical protein